MPKIPHIPSYLKKKPVAIFGYGVSGRGVHALARRMGIEATLFDEQEIEGTRQVFLPADAHFCSAVVLSPGFEADHPWVLFARQAQLPVMSELDFGALFLTRGVYAVTGTNGKTTVAEFLVHTLNLVGQNAVAVGHSGRTLCAWLAENLENEPDTRLVVEISARQARHLGSLKIDGLIWTNFSALHHEDHATVEEYFQVKKNLLEHLQKPLFVAGQSVFVYAAHTGVELPEYTLIVPNRNQSPHDELPAGTPFEARPFDENFRLCVAFGERIGLPRVLFHQAAHTFALPKHRLTKVADLNWVSFWNDAKCTSFAAVLAALERFETPVRWIGGGKQKKADLQPFVQHLAPSVKEAYLIGQSAPALASLLHRQGTPAHDCKTLENAVKMAFDNAQSGDVVLFSPGFSPSDQFENFSQRGNSYEKIVLELLSLHTADKKV